MRYRTLITLTAAWVIHQSQPTLAATDQEFMQSLKDNMTQGGGSSHIIALLCVFAGVILLMALVSHRNKNRSAPRKLDHHGKLLKEVYAAAKINAHQRKQLAQITEKTSEQLNQPICSPLVMLLCPSLRGPSSNAPTSTGNDTAEQKPHTL